MSHSTTALQHPKPPSQAFAKLKPEMIVEFRAVFSSFDRNDDGRVSAKEFSDVMSGLGFNMSDEQVRALISSVDWDRNGELDFEEFIGIIAHIPAQVLTDANIRKAFRALDKDNSGFLTRDEICLALQRCSYTSPSISLDGNDNCSGQNEPKAFERQTSLPNERQVDQFMERVDRNRDGKINYEEFHALVKGGGIGYKNA